MAWQDRSYYRDGPRGNNPLLWVLGGSLPLGTWFGIQVRVHASLLIFIGLSLLFPNALGGAINSFPAMVMLFVIVLLHEFGHCAGSRMVGGTPDQIMMTPLGGLAYADAPQRPWAQFWTVLCGPMVNVVICIVTALSLGALAGSWNAVPLSPTGLEIWNHPETANLFHQHGWVRWIFWAYVTSYVLLLFNLLPMFPLDGGQMLRAALWGKFGYYRASKFASITGMIFAGLLALWSLVSGSFLSLMIAIIAFMTCLNLFRQLRAAGPWGFSEMDEPNWGGGVAVGKTRKRHTTSRVMRRARKLEEEAVVEQQHIDIILAKVSAKGMQSLTWFERRALHKATQRQRDRDHELTQSRRGH